MSKKDKKLAENKLPSKVRIRLAFAAMIAGVVVLGLLLTILSHYQYI